MILLSSREQDNLYVEFCYSGILQRSGPQSIPTQVSAAQPLSAMHEGSMQTGPIYHLVRCSFFKNISIELFIYFYTCVHICMCACIHIYVYVYVYLYIYIHAHKPSIGHRHHELAMKSQKRRWRRCGVARYRHRLFSSETLRRAPRTRINIRILISGI